MIHLVPESPEWWLVRLLAKLEERAARVQLYEDYFEGKHPLAFATSRFSKTFGGVFDALSDNWCEIVVDAAVERMTVEGFRFGDDDSDDEAWEIWQANGLDASSIMAHEIAVTCGESYAMVAPGPTERRGILRRSKPGIPIITIEHPAEMIVECVPGQPLARRAALKKARDDDGRVYANVYLPYGVYKFQAVSEAPRVALPAGVQLDPGIEFARQWAPHPTEPIVANPSGVVPVIPLLNKPRLRGLRGRSDLVPVIPLQNVINKILADGIIASEFAAFPQRWATGIETHDDDDNPIDLSQFLSDVARVWVERDPNAKFGAFAAADLQNYVTLIEMGVAHVAAHTRTPPHYMVGKVVNVAEGALKACETGLVSRVKRKHIDMGESWEETQRVSFLTMGNGKKAGESKAETKWRDPESRSDAERVDAAGKMKAVGVPRKAIWRRLGASEEEIKDWERWAAEEDRTAMLAGFGGFNPDPRAQNVPGDPNADPFDVLAVPVA